MSEKTSRQVRKEVKNQADKMKSLLALQILDYMENTARARSFFARVRVALRYVFRKDFRGIMGE